MNSSKPKLSAQQSYSEYFILNDYLSPNNQKLTISHPKSRTHKRKTSQVSTVSCKSKHRNSSMNEKKNHTLNKHFSHNNVCTETKTHRNTKHNEKNSIQRKQFSVQRNRIALNNKHTLSVKRQKLKIDTDRKTKPKTTQNLTSRYLNYETDKGIFKVTPKNHMTSHSSFANKCDHTDAKMKSFKNKLDNQKTMIPKFKLREKNLQLMVSRCSHVMTEYYERITLLKKQNLLLRFENEELKKNQLEYL